MNNTEKPNSLLASRPAITFFSSSKKRDREKIYKKNYKLYRTSVHSDTFKYGVLPRKEFEDKLKIEEFLDNQVPQDLKEIFKKFVDYIDPINLEYCLKNISTVTIQNKSTIKERIHNIFSVNCSEGAYNLFNNLIKLNNKEKATLSHEFLHMSSASKNYPYFCGFSVYMYDYLTRSVGKFGDGLNEGYTELLNMRIFYNQKKSTSYIENVKIAKLIECFFDDYREMEYAYFHTDIDAVYNAFTKYGTRKEYFMIMNQLDYFADSTMLTDFISSAIIQLKLYEIIKRSNDKKKIKHFEETLDENFNGKFKLINNINKAKKL